MLLVKGRIHNKGLSIQIIFYWSHPIRSNIFSKYKIDLWCFSIILFTILNNLQCIKYQLTDTNWFQVWSFRLIHGGAWQEYIWEVYIHARAESFCTLLKEIAITGRGSEKYYPPASPKILLSIIFVGLGNFRFLTLASYLC